MHMHDAEKQAEPINQLEPTGPEIEPVDSDAEVPNRAGVRGSLRWQGSVLFVIAIGGGIGAAARYGCSLWIPAQTEQFPWSTFMINVVGCSLIGVLMVLVTEVFSAHHLVRPFLGIGVLGGFTTFSSYAVEIRDLLRPGSVLLAGGYLAATLVCAVLAVALSAWFTRITVGAIRPVWQAA